MLANASGSVKAKHEMFEVARDAELEGKWDLGMEIRLQAAAQYPEPIDIADCEETPFHRFRWNGKIISLDGCSADDFNDDDLDRVIAYGDCSGIAVLKDGRWVAWESWTDVTGSGFCADAYGGDVDIAVSSKPGPALEYLSEQAREWLKWS